MSSQYYIMNVNRVMSNANTVNNDAKPLIPKEKVMSYEEKSVGSTPFYKCEACPYMALAEDDIKFHLFTVHPDLARSNGLADNIQIPCPGCSSVFDAEETLRLHLRNHHKMGIKDVKKMIKSLVQIALKNAKLKKEDKMIVPPSQSPIKDMPDVKMPQVIEIVPDIVNANNESLPKGVAFITVDELQNMSTPNFEKVDPKEIIQEASINIVYTNDLSTQYVNVPNIGPSSNTCSLINVSNVPPDLISSIKPRVSAVADKVVQKTTAHETADTINIPLPNTGRIKVSATFENKEIKRIDTEKKLGKMCSVGNCHHSLKEDKNIIYHRKCHQNGKLVCPECSKVFLTVGPLHTHLWGAHNIDLELPTCEICGYKNYKRHRLTIHMKCHAKKVKLNKCPVCSKFFKNVNQLSKHKLIHKKDTAPVQCSVCQLEFNTERRLKSHMSAVHEKLKPFKCSHCDFTSARKHELKVHLRSHTGDKPYACDQCSYRSADHNAMRRHKKLHTKESTYKCKYCPYNTIQSTSFTAHMISKHPNVNSSDLHRCPYCAFKTVNKDKYIVHLTNHPDKEGIQLLIEMTKNRYGSSWTIPSESIDNWNIPSTAQQEENDNASAAKESNKEGSPKAVNSIPLDVYYDVYCDSLSESLPQDYSKTYCPTSTANIPQSDFNSEELVTDLSKDDNNSDCLISESSNDTLLERHQYTPQLQMSYDSAQPGLHGFLNSSVSLDQNLLQNTNVNSLASSHSVMDNSISNNILTNFPIRLPPAPQMSLCNNITLRPVDRIPLPMTKVTGPIITPTQILPVPSSSNSPVNILCEPEGVPRKKPKISVKSNLILKGPDQVNMFHTQQKMAFKRLEDNERFGLGPPVTFNNLITTQFMQLQPEPAINEPPNIITYPQETMLSDSATTLLPPPQKIPTSDPSYIKIEATIKQNTQSPSLERMCNANLLNNQGITREYKASPPLEDIHKNMNEIKNEVKSDTFYTMALNNSATNPSIIDQYLMDNIIGEQYPGHLDLTSMVLPETVDDQQNDVIEIDDNSDDNKLLPRFDMNFPVESLYLMQNDFHFLENDIPTKNMPEVTDMSRMVSEVVPIIAQKDMDQPAEIPSNDFPHLMQGKKDPMMNTSVRPCTNKINVKNIELMKN